MIADLLGGGFQLHSHDGRHDKGDIALPNMIEEDDGPDPELFVKWAAEDGCIRVDPDGR